MINYYKIILLTSLILLSASYLFRQKSSSHAESDVVAFESQIENYNDMIEIKRNTHFMSFLYTYYVYSCYWDTRLTQPFVRALGLIENKNASIKGAMELLPGQVSLDCTLWYETGARQNGKLIVQVNNETTAEVMGVHYKCYPFNKQSTDVPYAVSFTQTNNNKYTHKLIDVHQFSKSLPEKYTTICVKPFYGPFDDEVALIQFIIYYKYVLHVNKFIFYNLAISGLIMNLIRILKEDGENIELRIWNEPSGNKFKNIDFGASTAYADCLYSAMNGFVVIVELDEFIVPTQQSRSIPAIYQEAIKITKGKQGDALLITNRFFCNDKKTEKKEEIPIIKNIIEKQAPINVTKNSNPILFSSSITAPGRHFGHQFVDEKNGNVVCPESLAVVHHYSIPCDDSKSSQNLQEHKIMLNWKSILENSNIWKDYLDGKFY